METDRIELRNTLFTGLSNRKEYLKNTLSTTKETIARNQSELEVFSKTLDVFKQKHPEMIKLFAEYNKEVNEKIVNQLDSIRIQLRDTIDGFREDIAFYRRHINTHTAYLAELEESLSSVLSQPVQAIEKQDVLTALSRIKEYIPGTLKLIDDTEPKLIWNFENVFMRPTPVEWPENESLSFYESDQAPCIPLGRTEILVNLSQNTVAIQSAEVEQHSAYGWTGFSPPHPHILDSAYPCMGDFEPAVKEAIQTRDWLTLAVLVREFLKHANSEDSAGRKWYNFFTFYYPRGTTFVEEEPGVFYALVNGGREVHPLSKKFVLDRSS